MIWLEPLWLKFWNGPKTCKITFSTDSVAIIGNFIVSSLCLGITRTGGPRCLIFRKISRNFFNVESLGASYKLYKLCLWIHVSKMALNWRRNHFSAASRFNIASAKSLLLLSSHFFCKNSCALVASSNRAFSPRENTILRKTQNQNDRIEFHLGFRLFCGRLSKIQKLRFLIPNNHFYMLLNINS